MKKRLRIPVFTAILTIGLIGWLISKRHEDEPKYHGRPFTYWFKEYCLAWPGASGAPEEVTAAIRAMGSNAVPYLVKELLSTNQDSRSGKLYQEFVDGVPPGLRRVMPGSISADRSRDKAADALFYSKPSGHVLLPLLTNALKGSDVIARHRALFVLGGVGEGAEVVVPYLVVALKDPDPAARTLAAQSLRLIGTEATAAVPDLIEALSDPVTRGNAVTALGNAGADARAAIPPLREMMTTDTNVSRLSVAAAIHKIDPSQSDALTLILESLKQRDDPKLRSVAIGTLHGMGPAATNAIPELLEALGDPNLDVWPHAFAALQKIAPDPRIAVPFLMGKVTNTVPTNQLSRLNAAVCLVRVDATNSTALTALIEFASSTNLFRSYAIDRLGDAGPAAKGAIPVLKKALKDGDKSVRKSAGDALRKIEGDRTP